MRKINTYTPEFKAQMIKEAQEIGNVDLVARTHHIPSQTLHGWLNAKKRPHVKHSDTHMSVVKLKKQLADAELENKVLKELLKKTNQAWLKD